jgi:mono/diheme cytochrome c family protein
MRFPACTAAVAASAIALCTAVAGVPRAHAEITLPDGPGADLVYARCRTCHDLQYLVDSAGLLPAQWDAVLQSMHDYGLKLGDADRREILAYLTTYLGPNPPPPTQTAQAASSATPAATPSGNGTTTAAVDGHAVYERNCASCHGADAHGEAQRVPPLAGNDDLQRDPLLPVLVVLNGLDGPIDVEGAHFDSSMPAFDHLSDAQIAAVVNYVRDAPGGKTVTMSMVAEQRNRDLSAAQVHAYRERAGEAQARTR